MRHDIPVDGTLYGAPAPLPAAPGLGGPEAGREEGRGARPGRTEAS